MIQQVADLCCDVDERLELPRHISEILPLLMREYDATTEVEGGQSDGCMVEEFASLVRAPHRVLANSGQACGVGSYRLPTLSKGPAYPVEVCRL